MTPNHTIYDESIIPEQDASEETPDLPAAPEPTARQQRRSAKIPNNGRPANSFIPRVAGWLGLQPAIDAAQRRRKQARKAAKAVFHADLIAGRPSAGVQPLADMESARFETTGAQSPLRTERSIRQHRVTGPNASLAAFSGAIGRSRTSDAPPDFERHSRLCAVCSHPDRDAIEADFLHWRSPAQIAEDYGLPNFHPVYRHARATGLLDRRKTEVCRVMERYLEKVDSYTTDEFDQVTRAVRVYSHIGHDGRWFEGSRTNYVLTGQLPDASNVGAEIAPGTESFG
ncbi:MAG TPA: hypothetical protein VMF66_19245 [Candidatus Acidoferrum sp.]|nr:hypothetical protein [Candidatus Acidoferrum sp.]